jgi:hypothetical protein
MLPDIPKLIQLQERDQRIRALQKDLKDIPRCKPGPKCSSPVIRPPWRPPTLA